MCKKCDRGFITLDGYTKHKLLHDKKAGKIVCDEEGCGSEFSTSDSYKNHKRKYHPVGGIKLQKCSYSRIGCVKTFKTKSNRMQHEAGCPFNPKRVELKCELCKQGKFRFVEEAARTQACKTQLALMDNVKWITWTSCVFCVFLNFFTTVY